MHVSVNLQRILVYKIHTSLMIRIPIEKGLLKTIFSELQLRIYKCFVGQYS